MTARLDPIIERFRFSHHNIAIMFAMGMTVNEIARRTGFTNRRLMILLDDPTFSELIEHYRREGTEQLKRELPDALSMMRTNHLITLRQIGEWLEEADEEGGERIPLPTLVKVHDSMADRTGYSKHTSKTINMNVSFAAELDRAIERSGKGPEVKQIEGVVVPLSLGPVKPPREVRPEPRPRAYRRA